MFAQELFTALLISSVANLGAVQVNKNEGDQMCDITVGDVLGPLKQGEGDRDTNFSLLSYSFSLVSTVTSNGLSTKPAAIIRLEVYCKWCACTC